MKNHIWISVAGMGAVALAAAAWLLWPRPPATTPQVTQPMASQSAASPAPSEPASPVAAAPTASTPTHAATSVLPPLSAAEIAPALRELLGGKAASMAQWMTDDFAHRFVATVDNLGREHASALLWPVGQAAGRFTVEPRAGGDVISPDNALRYTPFVLMAESIDPGRAVDLYTRLLPTLQTAYADLGFPNRDLNVRVLEVIDLLLATPERPYPVKLKLTEVKGPFPSERPWVRYEFDDPALQRLAAGQKLLLRMGAVNERRLKSQLRALRQQFVQRFGLAGK